MFQLSDDCVRTVPDDELQVARTALLRDGYALLPKVLTPALVAAIAAELERMRVLRVSADLVERPLGQWFTDEQGRVLSAHGLERSSEFIFDVARHKPFVQIAEEVLGVACVPFLTEMFGKPSQSAEPTPPHQDQIFYADHFTDEVAVAMWCPLIDVGPDDSPLEYAKPNALPGQLLSHIDSEVENFGSELVEPQRFAFHAVPVELGDVLLHHSYTIHRSAPNGSGVNRQAFALNYRTSSRRTWPKL